MTLITMFIHSNLGLRSCCPTHRSTSSSRVPTNSSSPKASRF